MNIYTYLLRTNLVVSLLTCSMFVAAEDLLTCDFNAENAPEMDEERSDCKCIKNLVVSCALAANILSVTGSLTVGGPATFTGPLLGNGPAGLAPAGLYAEGYIFDNSTTLQSLAVAGTPINFNSTGFTYNITHPTASNIVLATPGIYIVTWSIEFSTTTPGVAVSFALNLNGTNVPGTIFGIPTITATDYVLDGQSIINVPTGGATLQLQTVTTAAGVAVKSSAVLGGGNDASIIIFRVG